MATDRKWLVFTPRPPFLRAQRKKENPPLHIEARCDWHRFPRLIASITRACSTIYQSLSLERERLTLGRATAVTRPIMSHDSSSPSPKTTARTLENKKDDHESDANIRNFAPVARIMKTALPENAKIAKEAKECMQECVSEFISFITSEGM